MIDGTGKGRPGALQTRAVRSDGSTLLALGSIGAGANGSRVIQFASGSRAQTDELQSKVSTTQSRPVKVDSFKDPASGCVRTFGGEAWTTTPLAVVGQEQIAGYRATKVAVGNNAYNWFAVDYGCALLKTRLEFGTQGASEFTMISFKPGEPDAFLFAVLSTFAEGPPTSLLRRSAKCPDCDAKLRERMAAEDRQYAANPPR